jgi:hypothetical protein
MADTIKVPGVGPVKTMYVVGGLAVVVGVVGYAYFTRGTGGTEDYVGAEEEDYGVGEYESPLGNSGGNSTVDVNPNPDLITTNAQWTVKAVDFLVTAGFEAGLAVVALGKYLARLALSPQEVDAVLAARAAVGEPPVGGPYPVKEALPNPPSTDPPPTNNPPTNNPPPSQPAPRVYVTETVQDPGQGWRSSFAGIAGHYGKSQSHLWNLDKNRPLRQKYNHYTKIKRGDTIYIDTTKRIP